MVWVGAEPSTGLLWWVLVGGGEPKNLRSPSARAGCGQGMKGKEDHLCPEELPPNCPGRKPVMLVWTGAVST